MGDAFAGGLRHMRMVMTCGEHSLQVGEVDTPAWHN